MIMIAGHQVNDAMFTYIARNLDADTCKLLLKAEPKLTFDKSFAILQIECRRKCRLKIPELLSHEHFLFPKSISAEQCTHEEVARFHASLFHFNDHVLDMTMGLGVDDYYIASVAQRLIAIELDPEIAAVGKHNFGFLASNVNVIEGDSIHFLQSCDDHFDAIFIDPARRGESGKRLYGLADCQPNVLSLLPLIKQHSSRLLIKASPMLDVTQSMRELGGSLTDIWAISIKNECKELLFKLDFKSSVAPIALHALNYTGCEWQQFSSPVNDELTNLDYTTPVEGAFLYEPNASIMKLGCYRAVEHSFNAPQLAPNSHLMVSNEIQHNFPGRKFRIIEVIPFKDKQLKSLSKRLRQANIATRNFRLSADVLKSRLRLGDGGTTYLFATTLVSGEQVLLLCEKI